MAGFKRFTELMDQEPDIEDRPNAVEVESLEGRITFRDVTFGYEAERPILNDLSFTIQPGQTVAFVGPSGAGKSTIAKRVAKELSFI